MERETRMEHQMAVERLEVTEGELVPEVYQKNGRPNREPQTISLALWHCSRPADRPKCVSNPGWESGGVTLIVRVRLNIPRNTFIHLRVNIC